MTADTLLVSLLRYGLAVTGSMSCEQSPSRLDVAVINVAARRILGVNISARLPTLLAPAGLKSIRNFYRQHCAEVLDSAFRVANSAIRGRLLPQSVRMYGATSWSSEINVLSPDPPLQPRILINPPEGDRSGGGAGLGLGGVKEKLRQKRDEERVGPRGDWISKAPSKVVHRD